MTLISTPDTCSIITALPADLCRLCRNNCNPPIIPILPRTRQYSIEATCDPSNQQTLTIQHFPCTTSLVLVQSSKSLLSPPHSPEPSCGREKHHSRGLTWPASILFSDHRYPVKLFRKDLTRFITSPSSDQICRPFSAPHVME